MTFCPGKRGPSVHGAAWARDLATDLTVIKEWGARSVVTLMESEELDLLGVSGLGDATRQAGMNWLHLPIRDGDVPDARFNMLWPDAAMALLQELSLGHRVVIHCRGGLGRTGLVTAMMLVESGETPQKALNRVRAARPGTIETHDQEMYLLSYLPVVAKKV